MKAVRPEDLEFLRKVRGRFPNSKSQRKGEWALMFLFLIVFPAFPIFVFVANLMDHSFRLDINHLFFAAWILGSFILGIHLFQTRAVEYEFTGEEIIERRAGRIKNQMRISNIVEIKVPLGEMQMVLKTKNSKMTVHIVPSLNVVLQGKKNSETMANMSEAERQHFDQAKKDLTLRLKRTNVIGSIILVLVIFLIGLLAAWLKKRGFFP